MFLYLSPFKIPVDKIFLKNDCKFLKLFLPFFRDMKRFLSEKVIITIMLLWNLGLQR